MRLSVLLAVLPFALGAPAVEQRSEPAPLLEARGELVANKYIVKLKEGSALSNLENTMSKLTGGPDAVFKNVFKGFAATLDAKMLDLLRSHPDVSTARTAFMITIMTQKRSSTLNRMLLSLSLLRSPTLLGDLPASPAPDLEPPPTTTTTPPALAPAPT